MAQVNVSSLPKTVRNDRMKAYANVFGNVGSGRNTGMKYDPRKRQALRKQQGLDW